MDLDNPSYFSLAAEERAILRRKESSSVTSLARQLTPPRGTRRELWNLLRSTSTNSADSNQELLIMGEPRLSDMDPDLAFKHPTKPNPAKRHQENGHSDLMYLPLPTSEEAADELDNDEVFISEDSARYYNFSAAKRIANGNISPRRHSIGNFSGRDRTNSVASSSKSFREDFSQMVQESEVASPIDEHSLRHKSFPRKRCLKCAKGTLTRPNNANMDDILIVSLKCSEAAALWVEYFTNYFQQISKQANRKPFKIQNLGLEDLLTNKPQEKDFHEKTSGVKLQLVVVCPSFLEFVAEHCDGVSELTKILQHDRTLALLLGVSDADLTETHKKALPTYHQWQRQSVGQDQDETFTKEFLGHAMTILSKIWKQQSSVMAQEKACFSVTPKKIRQGQNSVFVLLAYPLQKDDIVKISIERNGDLQEVKSVKRRNPYVIKITVPENLTDVTSIVNVLVEKNGSIIGSRPIKCESRLRELEQILRSSDNPVDFMCQTLGFTPADREHLDNWLVHGFQKNLPPHFNLLSNHSTPFAATVPVHKHSNEEFPTLLHFAAKFGLEKLAVQLLDCPGADVAYEIRNVFDLTPLEIAENGGFAQLSSMLRGYMNMNEVTTMYTKLKEMSLRQRSPDEDGYLAPKSVVQEFYKMCPAPRPVVHRSPLTTPSSEYGSNLYMAMSTPGHAPTASADGVPSTSAVPISESREEPNKKSDSAKKEHKSKHHKKIDVVEDKVQKELAEIINDFKNNVHSLPQVEKLVEDWKNRNDVQKSFKEKQEQLTEMRLRYEKIQQEMKNAMKKPTPFDRIKRLFSRHKSHSVEEVISTPATALNQSSRPISSLSTSSSGSSGRMSTISGCSLGDSGTHSDNEERKMMLGSSHNENDFKCELDKAIMQLNYTPVPVPKPVKFSAMHHFETIEEKPVTRPTNLPLNDQFYIQFPPNGLPVPGNEESPGNEYMNVSSTPDGHEYMNFKLPSA
ncbi:phosphoinositide 3-kinase adapter protein 1 [Cylas formicarius]|uniref:phosphoinositide 3-kinase adapter protein 1 n=1 Tax=Cylas formicarius TaxID=197179 RepID=UPI002958A3AA|nr:phosphoinositide 3-kinase adapter protein 1 [Cylas formicarius]